MLFDFGFRRLKLIQLLVLLDLLCVLPVLNEENNKETVSFEQCEKEIAKCRREISPIEKFCTDMVASLHNCEGGPSESAAGDKTTTTTTPASSQHKQSTTTEKASVTTTESPTTTTSTTTTTGVPVTTTSSTTTTEEPAEDYDNKWKSSSGKSGEPLGESNDKSSGENEIIRNEDNKATTTAREEDSDIEGVRSLLQREALKESQLAGKKEEKEFKEVDRELFSADFSGGGRVATTTEISQQSRKGSGSFGDDDGWSKFSADLEVEAKKVVGSKDRDSSRKESSTTTPKSVDEQTTAEDSDSSADYDDTLEAPKDNRTVQRSMGGSLGLTYILGLEMKGPEGDEDKKKLELNATMVMMANMTMTNETSTSTEGKDVGGGSYSDSVPEGEYEKSGGGGSYNGETNVEKPEGAEEASGNYKGSSSTGDEEGKPLPEFLVESEQRPVTEGSYSAVAATSGVPEVSVPTTPVPEMAAAAPILNIALPAQIPVTEVTSAAASQAPTAVTEVSTAALPMAEVATAAPEPPSSTSVPLESPPAAAPSTTSATPPPEPTTIKAAEPEVRKVAPEPKAEEPAEFSVLNLRTNPLFQLSLPESQPEHKMYTAIPGSQQPTTLPQESSTVAPPAVAEMSTVAPVQPTPGPEMSTVAPESPKPVTEMSTVAPVPEPSTVPPEEDNSDRNCSSSYSGCEELITPLPLPSPSSSSPRPSGEGEYNSPPAAASGEGEYRQPGESSGYEGKLPGKVEGYAQASSAGDRLAGETEEYGNTKVIEDDVVRTKDKTVKQKEQIFVKEDIISLEEEEQAPSSRSRGGGGGGGGSSSGSSRDGGRYPDEYYPSRRRGGGDSREPDDEYENRKGRRDQDRDSSSERRRGGGQDRDSSSERRRGRHSQEGDGRGGGRGYENVPRPASSSPDDDRGEAEDNNRRRYDDEERGGRGGSSSGSGTRPILNSDEERDARMRGGPGYENVPRPATAGDADSEAIPQAKKVIAELTEEEKEQKAKEDEMEVARLKAERDRLGRLLDGANSKTVDEYNEKSRRDRGPPPPSSDSPGPPSSSRSRDTSSEYTDDDIRDSRDRGGRGRDRDRDRDSRDRDIAYGGRSDQREEDLRYSRPEGRDRSAIASNVRSKGRRYDDEDDGDGGSSGSRSSSNKDDDESSNKDNSPGGGGSSSSSLQPSPVIKKRKLNDFISVPVISSLFK